MSKSFSILIFIGFFLSSLFAEEPERAFREDFRDDVKAHIPVVAEDLTSEFLSLQRLGPGADMLKLSHHPSIPNDPHYVWNGECKGPVLIAFPFARPLDLSSEQWKVRLQTKNVGKSVLHLALRVDDEWVVQKTPVENRNDWNVQTRSLHSVAWHRMNADTVKMGQEAKEIDFRKVDALGFAAPNKPNKPNRSQDCIRLDWFELVKGVEAQDEVPIVPKQGFLESETPFLRSALVFDHEGETRAIRRGVIVPLKYQRRWACFDPDTLRWAVVWEAPPNGIPLTYDSMASVSFPDAKAKAKRAPRLKGKILLVDPSETSKPSYKGRGLSGSEDEWQGMTLSGDDVILHYNINDKALSESAFSDDTNLFGLRELSDGQIRPGTPRFPKKFRGKNPPAQADGPFSVQPIAIPASHRPIRPTDLAFLSDGRALLVTLDGDIWQIAGIETREPTWMRVATGLFEPMAIEIDAEDRVFVLGRDQITELIDQNGDGHIDIFRNASDNFVQTAHTRDYSTSLALGEDGSFYLAKGGILMGKNRGLESEQSPHRGAIVKISPDGKDVRVVADGLRLPYVGVRSNGDVFASDQQGHYVPSTPIYRIQPDSKPVFFGHEPTNHRDSKKVEEPLIYFPYQRNRSGAAFVELPSLEAFPDFSPSFLHVSWNGRLFSILTPESGESFCVRWPLQLDFPSLNGAVHPQSGKLYVVGLGISGYLPTTPDELGLASISQKESFPSISGIKVEGDDIHVRFKRPLESTETVGLEKSSVRLFNIRRTGNYGSGHYKADGRPGEHVLRPDSMELSSDRQTLALNFDTLFRCSVFDLRLHALIGNAESMIEISIDSSRLPEASTSDLRKLEKEKGGRPNQAGNAEKGKALYGLYCAGCHSLGDQKLTGPPLNGIASRLDEGDLLESILKPTAKIAEGYEPAMPSFEGVIDKQNLAHLMSYLKTLR